MKQADDDTIRMECKQRVEREFLAHVNDPGAKGIYARLMVGLSTGYAYTPPSSSESDRIRPDAHL